MKSVGFFVRYGDSGRFEPFALRQISDTEWVAEIPASAHGNETIQFYVEAVDLSGHKGHFGTADKPKEMSKKWF